MRGVTRTEISTARGENGSGQMALTPRPEAERGEQGKSSSRTCQAPLGFLDETTDFQGELALRVSRVPTLAKDGVVFRLSLRMAARYSGNTIHVNKCGFGRCIPRREESRWGMSGLGCGEHSARS